MLLLDSEEADCLLNITGAFGVHLRGLFLQGRRGAEKPIHGVLLNNAEMYSPQEDSIVIDDCKIAGFSGHGVHLLRIWLSVPRVMIPVVLSLFFQALPPELTIILPIKSAPTKT